MEFRKRDIKAEAQKRADANPPPEEKPKQTGSEILAVGKDPPEPPKSNLKNKRFLLVIVDSEMFEYGDLRGIESAAPEVCVDRNYNQNLRQSVFAYPFSEMDNSRKLIDYWTNETKRLNKNPKFTMKTVKVSDVKKTEQVPEAN